MESTVNRKWSRPTRPKSRVLAAGTRPDPVELVRCLRREGDVDGVQSGVEVGDRARSGDRRGDDWILTSSSMVRAFRLWTLCSETRPVKLRAFASPCATAICQPALLLPTYLILPSRNSCSMASAASHHPPDRSATCSSNIMYFMFGI